MFEVSRQRRVDGQMLPFAEKVQYRGSEQVDVKGNGLLIRPKISQVFSLSEFKKASFSLFISIVIENGVRKGEKVIA